MDAKYTRGQISGTITFNQGDDLESIFNLDYFYEDDYETKGELGRATIIGILESQGKVTISFEGEDE